MGGRALHLVHAEHTGLRVRLRWRVQWCGSWLRQPEEFVSILTASWNASQATWPCGSTWNPAAIRWSSSGCQAAMTPSRRARITIPIRPLTGTWCQCQYADAVIVRQQGDLRRESRRHSAQVRVRDRRAIGWYLSSMADEAGIGPRDDANRTTLTRGCTRAPGDALGLASPLPQTPAGASGVADKSEAEGPCAGGSPGA